MKKIKLLLMALSILVLGGLIGFLVSGQLAKQEMDDMMRWGTEEGFKEIILEIINPEENQMEQLEPLVEKYAKLNGELHNEWKMEHGSLMRSLTLDLEEVLNQQQMEGWKGQGGHIKKEN